MAWRFKRAGFTLVELLVVIVIVGILMMIALPGYRSHVLKSNRVDAYTMLNSIMQSQERFALDNGVYTLDLRALGYSSAQVDSGRGLYRISASNCDFYPVADCVKLIAVAQGEQKSDLNNPDKTANINITLDSRGIRTGW